jgi:MFS family permease
MPKDQRKLLMLSSLGGILEFYDFIIFALFASYISKAFFPSTNKLAGIMITFATFAIGYLVRPLGGIVLGHFGDRIGRKKTFTVSILLMAIATLGIGLVPTYSTIGIAAPAFVICLRVIQGLSIGGEIPGAITYVSEAFTDVKGFACGVIFGTLLLGIVLGSVINAVILSLFSTTQMEVFGWRIPFLLGGIFGLLGYSLRKDLHETVSFLTIKKNVEKYPALTLLKHHGFALIAGTFITAQCAVIVTSLFLFIPSYFTEVLNLPAGSHAWGRTVAITVGAGLTVCFGSLTDRINAKILAQALSFTTIIFAYPIFFIYSSFPQLYWLSLSASALLLGFSAGVIPRLLSELYPTHLRYSGIAVSYNLGFALFGGLTPFISLSLLYFFERKTIPALYLIVVATISALFLAFIRIESCGMFKKIEEKPALG